MLRKVRQAIPTCLLIVVSLVLVYSVYAAEKKKEDKKSCIESTAKLTLDMGGVTGFAQAKSKCANSWGSMYLYAVVAGKKPKSNHNPFMGIITRKVETKVGANNKSNWASAIANDYGNNQYVNASVRGKV